MFLTLSQKLKIANLGEEDIQSKKRLKSRPLALNNLQSRE